MDNFDLRKYARAGAEVRLREIEAERQQIFSAFPELRSGSASSGRGGQAAARTATPRKRRRMSADARRRISEAQKRRWAAHRAKEKR